MAKKGGQDLRYQPTLVSGEDAPLPRDRGASTHAPVEEDAGIPCPYTIEGVCVLESLLARGGMSTLYKGRMLNEEATPIVIKVPSAEVPGALKAFENERTVLRRLKSPHIVPFLGAGKFTYNEREYPYLLMKYIEGPTLRQQLEHRGAFSWADARKVLEDMLAALDCLHEQGWCHCDIKPANILHDDAAKHWVLVDFGIAKPGDSAISETHAKKFKAPGTWDYMAPEQHEGKHADIRSDIYSLGKVVWELLIGEVPRVGASLPEGKGVDRALIQNMTAQELQKRYQTPQAVRKELLEGARSEAQRRRVRFCQKCVGALLAGLLLTCGAWYAGDWYVASKLEQHAEKWPKLKKLETAKKEVATWPFYWGQHWLKKHEAAFQKEQNKAKVNLEKEWKELDPFSRHTAEELKIKCDNFVKSWRPALGDNDERIALAKIYALVARIEMTKETDDEQWKLIDEAEKTLKEELKDAPVSPKHWEKLDTTLKSSYQDVLLRQARQLIEERKFDEAARLIDKVNQKCGDTSKVQQTRGFLLQKDWECVKEEAERFISEGRVNSYHFAWNLVKKFEKELPHEVGKYQCELGKRWLDAIGKKADASHSFAHFVEAAKYFQDAVKEHPQYVTEWESALEQEHSNRLVLEINRMLVCYNNNPKDADELQQPLNSLTQHVKSCKEEHQNWFNEVIDAFAKVLSEQGSKYQTCNEFQYKWERLPQDLHLQPSGITCHHYKIAGVHIQLSQDYYEELKGYFDAQALVEIHIVHIVDSKEETLEDLTPLDNLYEEQQSIRIKLGKNRFLMAGQYLRIRVKDDDMTDKAPELCFRCKDMQGACDGASRVTVICDKE